MQEASQHPTVLCLVLGHWESESDRHKLNMQTDRREDRGQTTGSSHRFWQKCWEKSPLKKKYVFNIQTWVLAYKKVRFIIFHPEEKPKLKIPREKHIVKILQDTGTGKDKDFHNGTPTKTGNDHKNWQVGLRGIEVSAVLRSAVWQPTKCNQSAIIAN